MWVRETWMLELFYHCVSCVNAYCICPSFSSDRACLSLLLCLLSRSIFSSLLLLYYPFTLSVHPANLGAVEGWECASHATLPKSLFSETYSPFFLPVMHLSSSLVLELAFSRWLLIPSAAPLSSLPASSVKSIVELPLLSIFLCMCSLCVGVYHHQQNDSE